VAVGIIGLAGAAMVLFGMPEPLHLAATDD
jgi:hypothetical protein